MPALLCRHLPCSLTSPHAAASAVKVVVIAIGLSHAAPLLSRRALLPAAPLLIAHLGGGYGNDLVLLCAWALGALVEASTGPGGSWGGTPTDAQPSGRLQMEATPHATVPRVQLSAGMHVVRVLHAQGATHALLAALHAGTIAAGAAAAECAAVCAWALGGLVRADPGAAIQCVRQLPVSCVVSRSPAQHERESVMTC